jgi:hypothetical protein
MIYENIPAIVTAAVRSIYQPSYVDLNSYAPADLWKFIDTNATLANISSVLSQVSLVVCAALAAFIVFIVIQRRALKAGLAVPASDATQAAAVPAGVLRGRWDSVVQHLDSPREAEWKIAVIEADTIVDDALARAGFPGATFGDRLSNIQPGALLSLDGVWWAHKIRNRLAHESDYFLRYTEARQAVGYYEAALSELQLL